MQCLLNGSTGFGGGGGAASGTTGDVPGVMKEVPGDEVELGVEEHESIGFSGERHSEDLSRASTPAVMAREGQKFFKKRSAVRDLG